MGTTNRLARHRVICTSSHNKHTTLLFFGLPILLSFFFIRRNYCFIRGNFCFIRRNFFTFSTFCPDLTIHSHSQTHLWTFSLRYLWICYRETKSTFICRKKRGTPTRPLGINHIAKNSTSSGILRTIYHSTTHTRALPSLYLSVIVSIDVYFVPKKNFVYRNVRAFSYYFL